MEEGSTASFSLLPDLASCLVCSIGTGHDVPHEFSQQLLVVMILNFVERAAASVSVGRKLAWLGLLEELFFAKFEFNQIYWVWSVGFFLGCPDFILLDD